MQIPVWVFGLCICSLEYGYAVHTLRGQEWKAVSTQTCCLLSSAPGLFSLPRSELCPLLPDFLGAMLFPGLGPGKPCFYRPETLLKGTIWENLGRVFREIASDLACKNLSRRNIQEIIETPPTKGDSLRTCFTGLRAGAWNQSHRTREQAVLMWGQAQPLRIAHTYSTNTCLPSKLATGTGLVYHTKPFWHCLCSNWGH